jgi:hypothetical protein
MMSRGNRSQVGGAVFLIGLGIVALLNFWWPGIMFVIGASLLASEFAETNTISFSSGRVIGAAVVVIIGLLGLIDFNIPWGSIWPIALIVIGLALLFGWNFSDRNKHKNG